MARSDERAAVPVVWCPECKTGNAPYDDLGCCFKCLCPVEQRHVVSDADIAVLREAEAMVIHPYGDGRLAVEGDGEGVARAELARREGKR